MSMSTILRFAESWYNLNTEFIVWRQKSSGFILKVLRNNWCYFFCSHNNDKLLLFWQEQKCFYVLQVFVHLDLNIVQNVACISYITWNILTASAQIFFLTGRVTGINCIAFSQ